MEASPTTYEFEQLYGDIPSKKNIVTPHGTFIKTINGREHQLLYASTEEAIVKQWKSNARNLMADEKKNYKKARRLYFKCLQKDSSNAQIHTFIGESYLEEGKTAQATTWLHKSIELNPIDYLAFWYLAEIHLLNNKVDSALSCITRAHIFNRNHPRLLKRLIEIYRLNNHTYYQNWSFRPKMYVYKDGETVVVAADGIWLTYGMYKAVWEYDSDYQYIKEQQAVTDYLFHQEMEATLGTFMTHSSLKGDDKRNYPAMEAFGNCLDRSLVEEFVMYEIMLVNSPSIAYHLTDTFMAKLCEYIQSVRLFDYANTKKKLAPQCKASCVMFEF
jgi:tetratricopeptide (TPR) repeat protein